MGLSTFHCVPDPFHCLSDIQIYPDSICISHTPYNFWCRHDCFNMLGIQEPKGFKQLIVILFRCWFCAYWDTRRLEWSRKDTPGIWLLSLSNAIWHRRARRVPRCVFLSGIIGRYCDRHTQCRGLWKDLALQAECRPNLNIAIGSGHNTLVAK